jgi:dipeptidyl aminopeptidase/acylaminoacyl peptidase
VDDPLPYLRQLTIPSLWLIGTADDRIPPSESLALLAQLKSEGKDITIVTFPGAVTDCSTRLRRI